MAKDNFTDLEQLLAEFEASDLTELHVRHGELEIFLSKDENAVGLGGGAVQVATAKAPVKTGKTASPPASAPTAAAPAADIPEGAVVVRAPYLGTFYRAPKPGAPHYVEIGQPVSDETEMCLVEVMKLFTAVRAGCSGTVAAILAEDGAMVAADQPLFAVMPG
ncbi:acetyl-CoA carboxylase biotin carboxyl carrier protein [Croceicoccus bisphenolivorans]|uniref:acetyl-CoA carboxylase biotin carboxyl carrier protein n=1 Tax=Croceicoccus bisphenolivorans TaxID=1783232 RepID=UPI00082C5641|nr:acetyl-CoA carboxylase biotin carboxyl carrier protein [Croceicoccus bisphenolivorans]